MNPSTPAPILRIDPDRPDPATIREAAAILRAGGLVAFPTETVYGLGADALNPAAVQRIFEAKGRPAADPLIVHVLSAGDAARLARHWPEIASRLSETYWPGPLTLVLPKAPQVPDLVTAGLDSVALRAPAHPVARALIEAAGRPIAAPSANPFGRTSPTHAAHVAAELGDRIDLILDGGPCRIGLESTVLDCRDEPPRLLRPGGIGLEDLCKICGEITLPSLESTGADSASKPPAPQRSPGTLQRHYAPRARMALLAGDTASLHHAITQLTKTLTDSGRRIGLLIAEEDVPALDVSLLDPAKLAIEIPGPLSDPDAVAANLYAALRALDAAGVDHILARDFGTTGIALAIQDRLRRAAEGRVIDCSAPDAVEAALIALTDSNGGGEAEE